MNEKEDKKTKNKNKKGEKNEKHGEKNDKKHLVYVRSFNVVPIFGITRQHVRLDSDVLYRMLRNFGMLQSLEFNEF